MEAPYCISSQLKDQTPIELRLVGPHDRERLLNGFARISIQTNIDRFHTFKKRFSEPEIKYLLTIDNVNHLAIGAIDCSKRQDVGIGLARYIRTAARPDHAEVAIVIIDAYQGKGLGKILYLELMKMAYQNNIRTFINIVGKDNQAMQHLLRSFNATKYFENDHVYEFSVDLAMAINREKFPIKYSPIQQHSLH